MLKINVKHLPPLKRLYLIKLALRFLAEVDKYSNTIFVAVAKHSEVNVIAIDIASGRQALHGNIKTVTTAVDRGKHFT